MSQKQWSLKIESVNEWKSNLNCSWLKTIVQEHFKVQTAPTCFGQIMELVQNVWKAGQGCKYLLLGVFQKNKTSSRQYRKPFLLNLPFLAWLLKKERYKKNNSDRKLCGVFVCFSAIIQINTKNSLNDKLVIARYFCSVLSFPPSGIFVSE